MSDPGLDSWIWGIIQGQPTPSGSFLHWLARTAISADPDNYQILRPVLLKIKAKYPKYRSTSTATNAVSMEE